LVERLATEKEKLVDGPMFLGDRLMELPFLNSLFVARMVLGKIYLLLI